MLFDEEDLTGSARRTGGARKIHARVRRKRRDNRDEAGAVQEEEVNANAKARASGRQRGRRAGGLEERIARREGRRWRERKLLQVRQIVIFRAQGPSAVWGWLKGKADGED